MGSENKIDLGLRVRKKKSNKKINEILTLFLLFSVSLISFAVFFISTAQDPVEALSGAQSSVKPACVGDVNADGRVGPADRHLIEKHFREKCGQEFCLGADLNRDYVVDSRDFNLLYANWGKTC